MDEITLEAKEQMGKTIEALKSELAVLRTGRASAAMLDRVECEYYGEKMFIKDLCAISSPEPRQLVVKPYDRNDIKAVATGISASNIGINPIVEADCIRLIIPALTEETRRDLAKKAKAIAENSKVSIRNVRREFIDLVKESDDMTDDLKKRVQDEIQKVVDEKISEVESVFQEKEKEIMSI
ncbi:MAG: ribosome recycling factor [Bacilli bacterium]|nr:ribosome recycling factor [Bacilli bacterium]